MANWTKIETPDWTIWQDENSCVNSSLGWGMPGEIINNAVSSPLRGSLQWELPFISCARESCHTLIKSSTNLCKWTIHLPEREREQWLSCFITNWIKKYFLIFNRVEQTHLLWFPELQCYYILSSPHILLLSLKYCLQFDPSPHPSGSLYLLSDLQRQLFAAPLLIHQARCSSPCF